MAEGSILTDELKKWIGHEFKPVVYEVEKGAIIKLARATGEAGQIYQNEEYAKKSKYGGIIAPMTFIASLRVNEADEWMMKLDIPQKRAVNAGQDLEFFKPIRPGDVITVKAKLAEISEREGKSGKMLAMVTERAYINQKGEKVATMRITGLRF